MSPTTFTNVPAMPQSTQTEVMEMNQQPQPSRAMDASQPHDDKQISMRGGDEMCPGRFCFIIPCPIPCDFCIC